MALVKSIRESPPDDWRYLEPLSGVWIKGDFFGELVDRVCEHREYKQFAPWDRKSVELMVQRQICAVAPPGVCRPEPGEDYRPFVDQARQLSRESVMSASRAALKWMEEGRPLVPKAEAERRAALCRGCRLNRPSPSWVCSMLCKTLDALVPENRREGGLSICGICSCSLPAKVLMPEEVIAASNAGRELRYPDYCWQGKDSTNPKKGYIGQ